MDHYQIYDTHKALVQAGYSEAKLTLCCVQSMNRLLDRLVQTKYSYHSYSRLSSCIQIPGKLTAKHIEI